MENIFKSLPESVKATFKASFPLVIVIILSIFVVNFGLPRVSDIRTQVSDAQSLKTTLTQKLSILQSFSQTSAAGDVNTATAAVPSDNPSAVVISQLKNGTSCCGVSITSIKSGTDNTLNSSLLSVNTTFQITGTRDGIINYLKYIETIAPISVINNASISETAGVANANVSILSFWAPYPKVIPSVTQPITDLTSSEKQVLATVATLVQPTIVQGLPSEAGTNPAPFGQ